jgi:hypothetical protein
MNSNIAAGFSAAAFANGARAVDIPSDLDLRVATVLALRGMLRRFDFPLDGPKGLLARFLA